MQSKNFKKSLAASKAKRSILLSRSEFEEQKDPENLRLSTLFYNKEEFFKVFYYFINLLKKFLFLFLKKKEKKFYIKQNKAKIKKKTKKIQILYF